MTEAAKGRRTPRIPLARPVMSGAEVDAAARVLRSGRLVQGEEVRLFEEALGAYLGIPHVVAVNSGTAALHLALLALGAGPGVEVIVPDYTFPATGNAVFLCGAVPVLADVDPRTWTLTADELRRRVTPRTRVVMQVDLFGYPALDPGFLSAAEEARVSVLEDAAGALGSHHAGRFCGTLGRAGCFSFHARKSLATGEGGAVVTGDERLAELVRRYRNHGQVFHEEGIRFELAGLNYRMMEMTAAVGRSLLGGFTRSLEGRSRVAARYRLLLAGEPRVTLPAEPPQGLHTYQAFVVRIDPSLKRDHVVGAMARRGIETTLGTYALHAQPLYQHRLGCREGEYPVSWALYRETLALPFYPGLTDGELDTVVSALRESLDES